MKKQSMQCADDLGNVKINTADHECSGAGGHDATISRRSFGKGTAILTLGAGLSAMIPGQPYAMPSNCRLHFPTLGLNAARIFDLDYAALAQGEKENLQGLISGAQSLLLETSAEHMRAQRLVGNLCRCLQESSGPLAVRLWADDAEAAKNQLDLALHQLGVSSVDLVQIEIRGDWREQLQMLRIQSEHGKVSGIGLVARHPDQFAAMEEGIYTGAVQFIRLCYSALERDAEMRLLPIAHERGVKLLADGIYASGKLLEATRGRELPDWLIESGFRSWEQLWLQYVISNPAVTTVMVPVTSLDSLKNHEQWARDILLSPAMRGKVARLAADLS